LCKEFCGRNIGAKSTGYGLNFFELNFGTFQTLERLLGGPLVNPADFCNEAAASINLATGEVNYDL